MKANTKDIVVQSYNLIASDKILTKWHIKNSDILMSNKKPYAILLKEHIANLIGHGGVKDLYFIYGRGTVHHTTYVSSSI